ncbi:DUF1702 family protein [Actinocorallia sp. A-T 12471]|uniref:DUF1702 family protein n=1 Tax=Actinocorallia sp. A-T 12471 TaxID=3089813 RepID=UPI0029CC7096|nr:DUF1702 family protein [Actinocorallia sp. A-T 12471]MDX6741610.1 DUF1702 family protein [Actinocorallia sp. A-T 12471]
MAKGWRAARRRILTPHVSATRLETRGFPEKDPESRVLLETVGAMFLTGYGHVMEARDLAEAERSLDALPERFQGFAYEGAGMACTMLDALPGGGGGRFDSFLEGRGGAHVYTAYVGVGWALARLPRPLWGRASAPDPLLRWLVLDGYGFHQAYFHTRRYVHEQHRDTVFPWPAHGSARYRARAVDQGVGRALWFVGGTHPDWVADLIDAYAPERHEDLWAGTGLAATYACGGSADELRRLRDRAGRHGPFLAQGSAFAAEARARGGILNEHTALATQILCGMSPEEAAAVCLETKPETTGLETTGLETHDELPAYEDWRQRIAAFYAVRQGTRP